MVAGCEILFEILRSHATGVLAQNDKQGGTPQACSLRMAHSVSVTLSAPILSL
ncbi:MAG TPA: hypothetical protein VMW89_13320 [Desulfatiglandales bacterium]|nr:hypothetical protein [Desulfatiglandales bacterium]